jgi:hypothetical protein
MCYIKIIQHSLHGKLSLVIIYSVKLSYKYRLYPNKEQSEKLRSNFSFCCFLYNSALEERNLGSERALRHVKMLQKPMTLVMGSSQS